MLKRLLLLAFLLLATPALAQQQAVEAALEVAPKGTRFGLLVVDETGREIVAVDPDRRFIPASNTKLFTTAAAFALLPAMDQPDVAGGARVWLQPRKGPPDAVLVGHGDARMSSASDCRVDCLATLADAISAKTRRVRHVIGEDFVWPDQRWSPGMSWNNIGTDSGTAVSALNLDDNELTVAVKPEVAGKPPTVTLSPYFTLRNDAVTIPAGGKTKLTLERSVNGMTLRLYGEISADAKQWTERIGIDDPAHYAAWTLRRMLEVRGVAVSGHVQVIHRPPGPFRRREDGRKPATERVRAEEPLAALTPPPLAEDVKVINKDSQNLHAQALFRRLGDIEGDGSEAEALSAIRTWLAESVDAPRHGYDFSDGSGMSTYNRLSPRATVALLRWAASQPWGEAWYASLPIAGVDGTLKRRFLGTPLEGNLAAKTGTLNATNALSGRFRAKSGQTLTFAFFANDVPDGTSAIAAMETALLAIHAAN